MMHLKSNLRLIYVYIFFDIYIGGNCINKKQIEPIINNIMLLMEYIGRKNPLEM